MPPVSQSCPRCHATYSSDDSLANGTCLVCGVPLVSVAEAASESGNPFAFDESTDGSSSNPEQTVVNLGFLAPARGPGEIGWLGNYRVLGQLGAGGMGIVLKAEDPGLKRLVALKVLRPEYAAQPAARVRFIREARAAAKVEHDHIVPIFQIAESNGTAFLAMPLLKGEALSATLHRVGHLPVPDAVRIGREIAEGLAAAHAEGMIHRDIKPGNVWLEGSRGRVRILDFGLARVSAEAGERDQTVTREGAVVGTPAYMSPEQARGLKVDHRTDLFSLGSVLYQMVTGVLPFRAANTTGVLMAVVMETPPAPAAVNPAVPPALNDLIRALLNKDPAHRPATAELVAQHLAAIQAGPVVPQAEAAEPPIDPGASIFADLGSGTDEVPIAGPPSRVRRVPRAKAADGSGKGLKIGLFAAGGIVLLGLLALGGWAIFSPAPRGTLVVEGDPKVAIIIRHGQEVVFDRTHDREFQLKPGDYLLDPVDHRDYQLTPNKVTIKKGARETAKIVPIPHTVPGQRPKPTTPDTTPKPATPELPKTTVAVLNGPTPPAPGLPDYHPVEPLPAWDLPKGAPAPAIAPFSAAEAKRLQETWAKHVGQPATVENKLGMTLALIPPGEFDFPFNTAEQPHAGPEVPSLRVRLTHPYYLGTTEVTVGQFEAFVQETGYKTAAETTGEGSFNTVKNAVDPATNWHSPGYGAKADSRHPVTHVSWNDATAFCAWLGKKEGAVYRLPTEAELRFAARAGSKLKFGPAEAVDDFRYHEWTADDRVDAGQAPVRPVGVKRANPFGLYDMLGNVAEWALDGTSPEAARYLSAVDPVGPELRSAVLGGCFVNAAADISPERVRLPEGRWARSQATGFRVLRELGKEPRPPGGPARVRPNQPLTSRALVSRPEPIPGLRSWTVEPFGPVGGVVSVDWSPAGDRIATAHGDDAAIRLWDRSGNLAGMLLGHETPVYFVKFSRDGKRLVSWADTLRVWDVATGKCVTVFPLLAAGASRAELSPNGSQVLCSGNGWTGVVDLATGRRVSPSSLVFAAACWSPDGKFVLVGFGDAKTLPAVYRTDTWEKVTDLKVIENGKEQPPQATWAAAWSPDGKWLALGQSNPLVAHVWDAKTYEPKKTLAADGGIATLAWHPDSHRLMVGSIAVWDALNGKKLVDLPERLSFAWSPDGAEAICGSQFRAASTGQPLQVLSARGQTTAGPLSLSADGQRMIDTGGRPGRLRDAATGAVIRDLVELLPGSRTDWSPAGDLVAVWGVAGLPVRLVDPETGGVRADLKDSVGVTRLAWAPAGKSLATATGSEVTIWDSATGSPVQKFGAHALTVVGLAWSPDGTRLATAGLDGVIHIWDPATAKPVKDFTEQPDATPFNPYDVLTWAPDGQTLWVVKNDRAYPLDLATGRYGAGEPLIIAGALIGLAAARDGKIAAKDGSDSIVLRTDTPAGKVRLGAGLGPYLMPAWLPDSRRLLSPTGRGHVVLDTFTRRRLGTLFPVVGGEHWLVVGPTGHYRGTPGVESHIVYVAMHDDGSQRTYTPAAFAEKFGWKNDPEKATFAKPDETTAALNSPPFEGYWPRLAALRTKGGKFWRADGTEVTKAADLTPGTPLSKITFQVPPTGAPLGDADVDALRNLPAVSKTFRVERAPVTDAALARALGFATFERITTLEVVNTAVADETAKAAAALPNLTRLTLTGTLVTDAGLTSLKAAKKLEALDLRKTKVTAAGIKALQDALPNCKIEADAGAGKK